METFALLCFRLRRSTRLEILLKKKKTKTMQRLFHWNCRRLLFSFQRAQNHDFSQTNRSVRMGLPFLIDEKQAIDAFDRWRKSFW